MVSTPYLRVLQLIMVRLKGQGITWALTGSLAFALQGIPDERAALLTSGAETRA